MQFGTQDVIVIVFAGMNQSHTVLFALNDNPIARFQGHIRNDVWISTITTIMKTLEYPMKAICLTRPDWIRIMTPILDAALPGVQKPGPFSACFKSSLCWVAYLASH